MTLLRFWHVASLDAPTVAVTWTCALAWSCKIHLPLWAPVLLALITWAVYIGDRLLDARAGLRTPPQHHLRDRHTFPWQHRRVLLPLALLAALLSLWIVIARLPLSSLKPDSLVAAATLAYFSRVHARRKLPGAIERLTNVVLSRAFLVGTLFTAGCILPVWSQCTANVASLRLLAAPTLFFAAIGWLNIRAIDSWEDTRFTSLRSRVLLPAAIIAFAGVSTAAFFLPSQPRLAALLALAPCSAVLLALLDALRDRLSSTVLRPLADLVLLTPALLFTPAFLRL